MKTLLLILLFCLTNISFANKDVYFLDSTAENPKGCPIKLEIINSQNIIQTEFMFDSGRVALNNFNFNAPIGLIKGLAYPLGAFSYYRNFRHEKGFYFQRKDCDRFGLLKKCQSWKSMQSYEFIDHKRIEFTLTDLFYRIDENNYPTNIAELPIAKTCTFTR